VSDRVSLGHRHARKASLSDSVTLGQRPLLRPPVTGRSPTPTSFSLYTLGHSRTLCPCFTLGQRHCRIASPSDSVTLGQRHSRTAHVEERKGKISLYVSPFLFILLTTVCVGVGPFNWNFLEPPINSFAC